MIEGMTSSIYLKESDFCFVLGGKEVLRICANGDFYVKGKLVENDREVYEGFKVLVDGNPISPSEALYGFMGWLTSRQEISGPFCGRYEAGHAAVLVNEFCKSQGFSDPRHNFIKVFKDYPTSKAVSHPAPPNKTHTLVCRKCAAEENIPPTFKGLDSLKNIDGWTFSSDKGWRCLECSAKKGK